MFWIQEVLTTEQNEMGSARDLVSFQKWGTLGNSAVFSSIFIHLRKLGNRSTVWNEISNTGPSLATTSIFTPG
jgi:hypothetical protein